MSNFLSIATVTATMRDVLGRAVADDVSGATATTQRPDALSSTLPDPGVNIFLYQVTPNGAWRNADLPTRAGGGELVQRPRVALDLHYLLTFYGADGQLEPQRVLGSVTRTLHAQPLLSPELIEATVSGLVHLAESDLAEEVERVKFMPLSLSLEELSKLWSVFFQTPYSLSTAYLATTVLIEPDTAPRRALPVRSRHITVFPLQRAHIEKVVSSDDEEAPVVVGDRIHILGTRLGGSIANVRIGEAELGADEASSGEITVTLSSATLRAGLQGVQVLYTNGSESNIAPLILRPRIARDASDNHKIALTGVTVNGTISATLTIGLEPTVGEAQRVTLHLNQRPPAADPEGYSFAAEPRSSDSDTVVFRLESVEAGVYVLRVQVAGAESLLDVDASGIYVTPVVTIP